MIFAITFFEAGDGGLEASSLVVAVQQQSTVILERTAREILPTVNNVNIILIRIMVIRISYMRSLYNFK